MRKYEVLLHQSDYPAFLEALAELGIAHVETIRTDLPEAAEYKMRQIQHFEQLIALLEQADVAEKETDRQPLPADAVTLAQRINALDSRLQELERSLQQLHKKHSKLAPWGELPLQALQQLQEKGLHFHLFVCPKSSFKAVWEQDYLLEHIWENDRDMGFVIISEAAEMSLPMSSGQQLSAEDVSAWATARHEQQAEQQQLKQMLGRWRHGIPMLQAARDAETMALRLSHVHHHTATPAGKSLRLLGMFVPKHKIKALEQLFERAPLVFHTQKPGPDDEVPVLLNNQRFSRLFHPIGDLFALPSYQELDLTPFFAPFFTLFFGMCLGDVGYGLLIVIAVLIVRRKAALAPFKRIFSLALILGSAAVAFGLLTGTFFGAELSTISIPLLERWKIRFLNTDELFNLSLILGIVQILFGMCLRMVNRVRMYGFVYGLSTLGWIVGIPGLLLLGLSEGWNALAYGLLGAGLALILLFNDPGKPLWLQFGKGLWDLYGITGLFGDVLSYIRLFALGLASGILGLVVNNIAFSVLDGPPVISWLFFVLILLVGHGLNFAISTLSAFVHPVRLTFVEFYKNAGFLGGGKAYDPFRKPKSTTIKTHQL
ncbi:MAG: V-type ATP synthase subunit I [Bacteroidia bacterium]